MVTSKNGFTLLELMIIIAIILILAAILMPVFIRAHEKNQQITCLHNQQQIVQTMIMKAQENNEHMLNSSTVWQSISLPPEVLQCPTVSNTDKIGYVYNNLLSGVSLHNIFDASLTPVIADGQHLGTRNGEYTNVAYSDADLATRHNNATVVGYLDGHAEVTDDAHVWIKMPVENFEENPSVSLAPDGLHSKKGSAVTISEGQFSHGKRCLKIQYDIPTILNSYVAAQLTGPEIRDRFYRVGIMVKGDGSALELKLRLMDARGEVFEYDGKPDCTFFGWKEVIFKLINDAENHWAAKRPGAVADGKMQYPVRFWQIIVQRTGTDMPVKGNILFDNITIWADAPPHR